MNRVKIVSHAKIARTASREKLEGKIVRIAATEIIVTVLAGQDRRRVNKLVVILAALAVGCVSGFQNVAADVSPQGWSAPVEMRFTNADTLRVRRIVFALRYTPPVEPIERRVAVEIFSPTAMIGCDTLTFRLEPNTSQRRMQECTVQTVFVRLNEQGGWRLVATPLHSLSGVWSVAATIQK